MQEINPTRQVRADKSYGIENIQDNVQKGVAKGYRLLNKSNGTGKLYDIDFLTKLLSTKSDVSVTYYESKSHTLEQKFLR